jgi:hypothetical protein
MQIVIDKLERMWPSSRLAHYLQKHLEHDLCPSKKHAVSTPYVLDMMSAVYQALLDDRELRLARLVSDPDTADPTAIFIAPEPKGWSAEGRFHGRRCHVFTSWDGPRSDYDREGLASLEVAICQRHGTRGMDKNKDRCVLRSYGWVNGVWVTRGEQMGDYVFPLPGITKMPNALVRRKRKRVMEDDG